MVRVRPLRMASAIALEAGDDEYSTTVAWTDENAVVSFLDEAPLRRTST